MLLARIVGTVVATRKDPRLVSNKLLLARPVDPEGKAEGNYLVAVDTVDAGVGETVLHRQRQLRAHGLRHEGLSGRRGRRRHRRPRRSHRVDAMQLARVIGDVVATRKDPGFDGIKLLIVQPLDRRRNRRRPAARRRRLGRRRRRRARVLRARQGSELSVPSRPKCRPMPASSASSITGPIGRTDDPRAGRRPGRVDAEAPAVRGRQAAAGAARDAAGRGRGHTLLAIDSVGAGVSERVIVVLEGRAAGEALGRSWRPSTPPSSASSMRSTWRSGGDPRSE